jgi:hypothetical protein
MCQIACSAEFKSSDFVSPENNRESSSLLMLQKSFYLLLLVYFGQMAGNSDLFGCNFLK